jgi:hypothetical protein
MVLQNLRAMLQRGAKDGLWDRVGRGKYKGKTENQNPLFKTN